MTESFSINIGAAEQFTKSKIKIDSSKKNKIHLTSIEVSNTQENNSDHMHIYDSKDN